MIKRKNIVIGVTVLTVIFSTGAAAYAATSTTDTQTATGKTNIMSELSDTQRDAVMQARTDSMKAAISELVDNGTITQEIADQLPEAKMVVKEKSGQALTDDQRTALREEENTIYESKIADLIDEGTLTQDQIDQLEQAQKLIKSANLTEEQQQALMQARMEAMKEAKANLVKDGTLIEDTTNAAINTQKEKSVENKPAGLLTDDQQTALKEAMKTIFEGKLSDLVDAGTITQDQADELLNDNGPQFMVHKGRSGGDRGFGPMLPGLEEDDN